MLPIEFKLHWIAFEETDDGSIREIEKEKREGIKISGRSKRSASSYSPTPSISKPSGQSKQDKK